MIWHSPGCSTLKVKEIKRSARVMIEFEIGDIDFEEDDFLIQLNAAIEELNHALSSDIMQEDDQS